MSLASFPEVNPTQISNNLIACTSRAINKQLKGKTSFKLHGISCENDRILALTILTIAYHIKCIFLLFD